MLVVRSKRLNKIKLEDVIAILTLSLFSSKIILLHFNFYYKQFNYKDQSKKYYANNKRQLCISKDWLNVS